MSGVGLLLHSELDFSPTPAKKLHPRKRLIKRRGKQPTSQQDPQSSRRNRGRGAGARDSVAAQAAAAAGGGARLGLCPQRRQRPELRQQQQMQAKQFLDEEALESSADEVCGSACDEASDSDDDMLDFIVSQESQTLNIGGTR
jgi:hypothetical protein